MSRFPNKEQSEVCAFSGQPISPGLATAKIDKNSEEQGLFGKNVYFYIEKGEKSMSYSELAQLELMNALNSIHSEVELNEFKDLVARNFAEKAQKAMMLYGRMVSLMKKP